jgi:diaminohydroxyphosphoribosylaminopyrimidine deaminase/5-amino-6-(5-phosphoribosylamino)uracil reductase
MRRALRLAAEIDFRRGPNPRVGCVLLDADGRMIGEGAHRGAGQPHAEVEALSPAHAGTGRPVHTAVVTLEPCAHHGRTAPCVDALLEAGVRRVVFAADDPNPVAAGGAQRLRDAGVEIRGGLLAAESEALNPTWTFAQRTRRPYVRWKTATTLDGYVAAHDRSSRWISSATARRDAHRLRAQVDAVLVGTGTVLSDDPQLCARDGDDRPLPRDRQPLRVVVGRRSAPAGARVNDEAADTIQLTDSDPGRVLALLFERGVHDVLLEGGPTLAAAFLRAGLVDEVIGYVAPVLLGRGVPGVGDLGIRTITDACRLEVTAITVLESDPEPNVKIVARVARTEGS